MSQLPAVIQTLVGNLEKAQNATPVSLGDFMYLKMSKAGEWLYGAEETEVDPNSAFVIDPSSYAQGFVAWLDGELVDEKMALAGQPPVTVGDLPQLNGTKWDAQVSFALKGVDGREEGVQLIYKTSSKGGKAAISDLLGKIITRGRAGETALCPIVVLENSSYKHKKYGKIYTPVLAVEDWVDVPEDEPETAEPVAEVEPEPEPEPVTQTRTRKRRNAA